MAIDRTRVRAAVLLAGGIGLAVLVSCSRTPIERAVRGGMLPTEENLAVRNHCQSCHVHAAFESDPHMEKVRRRYAEGDPLREANRCLQCHSLRLKTMFRDEARRTSFPHGEIIDAAKIPKPAAAGAPPAKEEKKSAAKKEEKKKERKWYFLYLF